MGRLGSWHAGVSSSLTNARLARDAAVAQDVPAFVLCANGKGVAFANGTATAIYGVNVNATSHFCGLLAPARTKQIEFDAAFLSPTQRTIQPQQRQA